MQTCETLLLSISFGSFTDRTRRRSSVNAESLEHYKELIETAKADLDAHLESIDDKLEAIVRQNVADSNLETSDLRSIEEERLSTEKCLQICAQLSEHISEIQLTPEISGSHQESVKNALPFKIANEGLQECKSSLHLAAAKLETHMKSLLDQCLTKSKIAATSKEDLEDLERLRDQWETTRQCLAICSRADDHLKQNISTIDNYATGDAIQFMVSTDGKTIHGKNNGLGWRTRQVGGHISDASLQQLSRDFTTITFRSVEDEESSSRATKPSISDETLESQPASGFKERYGPGFKLAPRSTPEEIRLASTTSPEVGQGDSPRV